MKKINKSLKNFGRIVCFLVSTLFSLFVFANPEGGQVEVGNATIQQSPNSTVINQSSSQAIINWQSFNIGASQSTHFQQPAGGVALNRINPNQGTSQIYGSLSATGQIILINPAGIYFGPSAHVNVGGLIASTADMSNQNFLNGIYHFSQVPNYYGSIINEGQIIAANHGLVALIGSNVSNKGLIQANMGNIVLASGKAFTMSFAGNEMISFKIDEQLLNSGVDENGKPLRDGVSNTGKLIANGGKILVTAASAQGVLDHVINMQGIAEAKSVSMHNGELILNGNGGTVVVSGKLIATGKRKNQQGGTVQVLGDNIYLSDNALIDVSAYGNAGQINIGGSLHGEGLLPNANAVVMSSGTKIFADSLVNGNGGNVVVWSNNFTNADGFISVRGGQYSGNGGFIETSSKNILVTNNLLVDTRANNGSTGIWLLDPYNITINATSTTNGAFSGGDPNIFTPTGTATILNTTLNSNLANANVQISTGLSGSAGSDAGTITVNAPITWASTNSLTFIAANMIAINAAINTGATGSSLILNTNSAITQTAAITGSGGLVLQGTGTFTMSQANTYSGATILNAGSIVLNGSGTALNTTFTVNSGASLTLDNSATSTNNFSRINTSNALTLNGGQFIFDGSNVASTTAAQTVGTLALSSGYSTVTLNSGAGGSTVLTFAGINDTTGATALFRGTSLGGTPGAGVTNLKFTSATGLNLTGANTSQTNKPIVPFAIGDTSATGSGSSFVTNNINQANNTANTNGIRPLSTSNEYAASPANGVNLLLSASRAANDNFTLNSLMLSGGVTYNYNTNGNTSLLTITSGNILSVNGANSISPQKTPQSKNTLSFSTKRANIFAVSNLTFGALNSITGSGGLSVSGPGTVIALAPAAASSPISGGMAVNSGTLQYGINNAFTSQAVTVYKSGTLDLNFSSAALTLSSLTLNDGGSSGNGALTLSGSNVTVSSPITLASDAIIGGAGSGTMKLGGAISGSSSLTISLPNASVSLPAITITGNKNINVTAGAAISTTNAISTGSGVIKMVAGTGLTLNSTLTSGATSGYDIILADNIFTNNAGASALSTGGGNFQIWSASPITDTHGGVISNFIQYGATYGSSTLLGTGNGFLYAIAATATPVLTGTISRIYNASTVATLAAGNYTTTGQFSGDTITLNNPTSGTYASKNVGTGINVAVSGLSIVSATNGSIPIYGYTLTSTSANANIGTITQAPLTISSNSGQTKTYGANDPVSAATAYSVTSGSLYGTDSLTGSMGRIAGETVGSYNFTKNTVAVSDGNSGSNYSLTFNGTNNPFVITKANLTGSIANQSKVYGSSDPSLSGIAVTLGGVVNRSVTDINGNVTVINDTGNVNTTLASLARAVGENVGSYNITAATFNALTGSAAGNYNAPSFTGAPILTISKANLTGSILNQTKVYGNNDPALAGIGVTLGGVVNSSVTNWMGTVTPINDTGNVSATLAALTRVVGENVGSYNIITSNLILGGSAAGNYSDISTLSGNPQLIITKANLIGTIADLTKVYGISDPAPSSINVILGNVINNANIATWNGIVSVNDIGQVSTTLASYVRVPGQSVEGSPYPITGATFNPLVGSAANNYNAPTSLSGNPTLTIIPGINPSQIIKYVPSNIIFPTNYSKQTIAPYNISNAIIENEIGVSSGAISGNNNIAKNLGIGIGNGAVSSIGGNILNKLTIPYIQAKLLPAKFNMIRYFVEIPSELSFTNILSMLLLISIVFAIRKVKYKEENLEISTLDDMSFELRTSLDTILGFAKLMQTKSVGNISDEQQKFLEYVISQANEILLKVEKSELENNFNLNDQALEEMSFELRTALNNIIGYTNLIYDEKFGSVSMEQKKFLADILYSSNNILELIPAA